MDKYPLFRLRELELSYLPEFFLSLQGPAALS
jgi:hypothetical protein